jgi:hypothetical protein
MKANHNRAMPGAVIRRVVANISCSKNESKSQQRIFGYRMSGVVANISCSKNESKSQLVTDLLPT